MMKNIHLNGRKLTEATLQEKNIFFLCKIDKHRYIIFFVDNLLADSRLMFSLVS